MKYLKKDFTLNTEAAAIKLVSEGKSIKEIAKDLAISRQGVYFILEKYALKNSNLIQKGEIFFEKFKDTPKNRLSLQLTKIARNDVYVSFPFVLEKRFKKENGSMPKKFKDMVVDRLPCDLNIFFKKGKIDVRHKEAFKKMCVDYYNGNILVIRDHIVSIKNVKIRRLLELAAPIANNMDDLYCVLSEEEKSRDLMLSESIRTIDDFKRIVKRMQLSKDIFFKTCDASWEIRASLKIKDGDEKKVLKESKEIIKNFFNAFHIEVLQKKLVNKNIKKDKTYIKELLVENNICKNYKASLVIKLGKNVESNKDIVKNELKGKCKSVDEIIKSLEKKGRIVSDQTVRLALSKIGKENKIVKTQTEDFKTCYEVK